jgi:ferric-dicitrate binding protein FerR (iron transport regulator)
VNAGSGIQHSKLLSPGQQAVLNMDADNINIENNADAESSISWVKGVFHFEKANLDYVMRQLSRWYDVQVEYEGTLHPQTITGDVGRNIKLSRFLELLGKMGKAKYIIQGKTVKVIP